MDGGGIHFLKTEVLELSLVTIPANAEATITSVKAIDRAMRREAGDRKLARAAPPVRLKAQAKAEPARPGHVHDLDFSRLGGDLVPRNRV
jgi:hypothetical protein